MHRGSPRVVVHRSRILLESNVCSKKDGPMTSLLAPPHADPAAGLHVCLDELAEVDIDALTGAGQAALLGSLTRAEARIAALKLRVISGADRSGAAASTGAADTAQWAAKVGNTDPVVAYSQVGLARDLDRCTAAR